MNSIHPWGHTLLTACLFAAVPSSPVQAAPPSTEEDLSGGRIIVKMKTRANGTARLQSSESNGLTANWVRDSNSTTRILEWPTQTPLAERRAQLNRLRSDPNIESATVDRRVSANAVATDPHFASQWYLASTRKPGTARFDEAWNRFRGSASTVVAVIDTGVLYSHPDLVGKVLPGYDFISSASTANDGDGRDANASDPGNWIDTADQASDAFKGCPAKDSSWHGTFISTLIAGNTNNGTGVAGANWNARILPIRVLGKCGGWLSDVMDGMRWAAGISVPGLPDNPTPAHVINLSLGGSLVCENYEQGIINEVLAKGAVVVAAAGNTGATVESPARCAGVIAVGALDGDGSRAAYSAEGAEITLMAPGGYYDTLIGAGNNGTKSPGGNSYVTKTGTSFSTPLVSAAVSLIKGINPDLNATQIRQILTSSARSFVTLPNMPLCTGKEGPLTCSCTRVACGAGMLDAGAAVTAAQGSQPLAVPSASLANGKITLDAAGSNAASPKVLAGYRWTQLSGSPVLTTPSDNATVVVDKPAADSDLLFQLTVTDSAGISHSTTTSLRIGTGSAVSVAPVNTASDSTTGTSAPTPQTGNDDAGSATTATSATSSNGSGGGGALNGAGAALLLLGMWAMRRTASSI
ncbi:MAG: S8 family serine peptidase [Burkholderiaceae bacterium]